MRTTLTLDADVARKASELAIRNHAPFKRVINDALRRGFDAMEKPQPVKRYRTKARALGLRKGNNVDNIQELLSKLEGEESR